MGPRKKISEDEIEYNAEITRRIEKLRVERRLRIVDVVKAAGISHAMFVAYRLGKTRWSIYRLRLIAAYLGVPLGYLAPAIKNCVEFDKKVLTSFQNCSSIANGTSNKPEAVA